MDTPHLDELLQFRADWFQLPDWPPEVGRTVQMAYLMGMEDLYARLMAAYRDNDLEGLYAVLDALGKQARRRLAELEAKGD
ncbi:hypothetical protein K2O51_31520 (plasmid) [Cupriavidus pinatubonensis]|uniref:hypothetical protein n=1 Tax=Cupriavidus pinatubonensis TaxID=248026 RepID=UPI001C733354|nr:hypothetical protein [Cupriavidus pinatubonensis]QYY33561.1 hypothetical protein K2O51_31520 [Cupriavidus pinatubonensis]